MITTQQDTTTNTVSFEVGERYTCSSPCDSGCVWTYEVVRRTAQFVTLKDVSHGDDGEIVRVKVRPMGFTPNVECCSPHGTYSMAALLCADDIVETDELPEDFDYAGLADDLDELESTDANVKAAGDKLRAAIETAAAEIHTTTVATFTMRATTAGMTATCDRCQASVIGDRTVTGAFVATHTCETIR